MSRSSASSWGFHEHESLVPAASSPIRKSLVPMSKRYQPHPQKPQIAIEQSSSESMFESSTRRRPAASAPRRRAVRPGQPPERSFQFVEHTSFTRIHSHAPSVMVHWRVKGEPRNRAAGRVKYP